MRLVLNTNLLVLFIIGATSEQLIEKHKRTRSYTIDDYGILHNLIFVTESIVVTPNILAETSNLIGQIGDPDRGRIFMVFRNLIHGHGVHEFFVKSDRAAAETNFIRLGLTDAAILSILDDTHTLLTDDLQLYLSAAKQGLNADNFNHYRQM
jgi:hypothetical protein